MGGGARFWVGGYLCGGGAECRPVQPREDVGEQVRVGVDLVLGELGVFGVQGKGEGGGFAGFDGAGEEV